MKRSLIVLLLFYKLMPAFSQDFYINNKSEGISLNYRISPKWVDLNINESYDFLNNSGFTEIETTSYNNKEFVSGKIRYKEYIFTRQLVFEDKIIKQYSDAIIFIHECVLCLANDAKLKFKYNPDMLKILESSYLTAEKADISLKEIFYKYHIESLKSDGINSQLLGDVTDYGFKFSNSIETEDFKIVRNCQLKLDENKIYEFYSQRIVTITAKNYIVDKYNLKDINQYDLNLMVDVFLLDCKSYNITVNKVKVIATFETLGGDTLGLSYGINNDELIKIKIDPEKWYNASAPKRWYLIYHELGHDVLNLYHGNGGKMMFNFVDQGYSWNEFWEDREYMFNTIKK